MCARLLNLSSSQQQHRPGPGLVEEEKKLNNRHNYSFELQLMESGTWPRAISSIYSLSPFCGGWVGLGLDDKKKTKKKHESVEGDGAARSPVEVDLD